MGNYVVDLRVLLGMDNSALFSAFYYRPRHAVREMLLDTSRSTKHLFFGVASERYHLVEHRLGVGERAGLVEHDGIRSGERLEVLSALYRNALVCGFPQR